MKYAVLIVILIFSTGLSAQPKPKSTAGKRPAAAKQKAKPQPSPTPLTEKEQFDKASAHELAADRVAALEEYLVTFPESENRTAATDLLISSRVLIAEEKLISGNAGEAIVLFKRVIADSPQPVPNDLFTESIGRMPAMLFRYNQRQSAFEIASLIEAKVESNTLQLLEMANFYISIENGGEAMRVAAKAAAKDPKSAAVYRTLALAHRINFDLESSADAYAKALELEPDSISSKRGLAEMKRALGKSDEAVTLYRELLAKNEGDIQARNGLVLGLFDAGKRAEAETELAAALARSPNNVILLAGAAYWYASRGLGDKAIELGERALQREPRYIWAHIALGRGLMAKGKPAQAEQVLFRARAHGNFPTLEYELASARAAAGFYREAAEDLVKQFSIAEGGVRTNLGGRVSRVEKSFPDLIGYERRASIFTPVAADSNDAAETLRALLDLEQKLQAATPNETDVAAAADSFVKGTDKMKLHRQLYAASLLLQKRIAVAKALELVKAATGNTDAALEVADPGAAVMASELYDSRAIAFKKNEVLLVPDVPKQTLSAILRGRIEEITGWALDQQGNHADATVRFRRAITVMPDKSAWWRSSMWRLGTALAAEGKDAEALGAYIESYKTDKPDYGKYAAVEALYRRVNGSVDGLEALIGTERVAILQALPEIKAAAETPVSATSTETSQPTSTTEVQSADATPQTVDPAAAKTNEEKPVENKPVETKPADSVETAKPPPDPVTDTPKQTPETDAKIESPAEKKLLDTKTSTTGETRSLEIKDETAPEPKAAVIETEKAPEVKTAESMPASREQSSTDKPEKPAVTEEKRDAKQDGTPDTKLDPVPIEKKPTADDRPAAAPDKPKVDEAPPTAAKRTSKLPTAAKASSDAAKPLFEPIIITIPNTRPRKIPDQTAKGDETAGKKAETADVSAGASRVRQIDARDLTGEETAPCTIGFSQDHVSLINDGGTVGILVSLEGGDIRTLTAAASSPKDVEVKLEPEIVGMPDRRFFVLKSTSTARGVYQIIFAAPCGKKELVVTVR